MKHYRKFGHTLKVFKRCNLASKIAISMSVFVLGMSALAGSAWSFDQQSSATAGKTGLKEHFTSQQSRPGPNASITGSCKSLLDSVQTTPPGSPAVDRDRRSAGKAAALGLIFGVRFALSPPVKGHTTRKPQPRFDAWLPEAGGHDRYAMAVADYRKCRKEQALRAIREFRWSR